MAEGAALRLRAERAEVQAKDAAQAAKAESEQLQQAVGRARAEAEEAVQAAGAEAAALRGRAEQAVQEAERLRAAEIARAAAQAREPEGRSAGVASRIDEVQFRRLQEAEQARKSLGRLARIKAAWRGE